MKIDSLKTEAKRLGLRVTKKIRGKRIPLTEKELRMKIQSRQAPALEIQVRETKKLLRTCKSLFKEMGSSSTPTVSKPKAPQSIPKPKPPIPLSPVSIFQSGGRPIAKPIINAKVPVRPN